MGTRRSNGEGTLYRARDGRWRGQASLAGRRPGVSGRTRAEAARKLRGLLAAEGEGGPGRVAGATLGDLLARWLAEVGQTRKPRTHRLYRDLARLHLLPALGALELAALQPQHVRELYAALLARGLAPKTVRNVHHVLHGALQRAVAWRLVAHNAADGAPLPRVPHREMAVLDPSQARRLLATARGGRWVALMALALASGMRQGELLGLRWADVDLAAGLVRVQRQLGRDGTLAEPKTPSGRRAIDLPASTVAALRAHRRAQDAAGPRREAPQGHQGFVFCTRDGRPLGWRNVTRAFKGLLRQAGLPDVPFHALRHTAATLLIKLGVHPKVMQERLGHSSAATTLDLYGHLLPGLGREAAARLDDLLE